MKAALGHGGSSKWWHLMRFWVHLLWNKIYKTVCWLQGSCLDRQCAHHISMRTSVQILSTNIKALCGQIHIWPQHLGVGGRRLCVMYGHIYRGHQNLGKGDWQCLSGVCWSVISYLCWISKLQIYWEILPQIITRMYAYGDTLCTYACTIHMQNTESCHFHANIVVCMFVCVWSFSSLFFATLLKGRFQILLSLSPFNDLILAFSPPWYGSILIILLLSSTGPEILYLMSVTSMLFYQLHSRTSVLMIWFNLNMHYRRGDREAKTRTLLNYSRHLCIFFLEGLSTLLNLGFDFSFFTFFVCFLSS